MKTKKIFVALIAILAVLALASCAGGDGSDSGGDNTQSEHVHTEEIIPAKEATCTESGLTEGKKCADCGEILVAQEIIAVSHKFENSYTCAICKQELHKPSDGLEYALSDDGTYYTVSRMGTCEDTDIVIPYTHNELPVTSIGNYAFSGYSRLTEIVIPNSVTSIGRSAFQGCTSLKFTEYDNGLYLGNKENPYLAFVDSLNSDITSCEINATTKIIGDYAFSYCDNLTKIVIPDSVTSIGSSAFRECDSLSEIVMPNSVTSIGESAFKDCDSLTEIVIPSSVTTIYFGAFSGCDSLTEIVIPDSVTSIGNNAFSDCDSLTIYCEATSKPSGWYSSWNSDCPVVWGHVHSYLDGECVCGMKQN